MQPEVLRKKPRVCYSMEPEAAAPAAAATTEMAIPAVVPAEFEIPAKISEMLAGDASGPYQFTNFNYTVDKRIKFDVDAAETWQHVVTTKEWAQVETNSCYDATYEQFLGELAVRAKKGHYIFRDDDTLIAGDMSSVVRKARHDWKELEGRNVAEREFIEHVKPILKSMGEYMYETYKHKPGQAMNKTWDLQKLITLLVNNTWKHKNPPNFGWTVEKMHRALGYDTLTYETNTTAHTCKLLNWDNVVNYHLVNDFDPRKLTGEWAQAAQCKGLKPHWQLANVWWYSTPYKGKGPGKNPETPGNGSNAASDWPYNCLKGDGNSDAFGYWGYHTISSSSWDSSQNTGGRGKGMGSNNKGDGQDDKKHKGWEHWA